MLERGRIIFKNLTIVGDRHWLSEATTCVRNQNNGKRNLFSQNWSDNDAKKNRLQDFYDIFLFARVGDKMTKTGTVDLMKYASKIYF